MNRAYVFATVFSVAGVAAANELVRAPAARWCVTLGHVDAAADGRARVTAAKMRAVVPRSDGNAAELVFVYRGPSDDVAPLASGELRRQIGIKLRAEDGCNLVYVMWRLEPKARIVVSLKRNPGQRTHAECGARGYRNLTSGDGVATPPLLPGETHALAADLVGSILRVRADGAVVWQGDVGGDATALRGPAGLRTDNGKFDVELRARGGDYEVACARGDD
jgi:hypothetical protein